MRKALFVFFLFPFVCYAQLPVFLNEEFTDNSHNWPVSQTSVVANGVYKIDANGSARYLERNHCIDGYADFTIETSFEVLNPTASLAYGIHWGNKSDNGCSFLISESGIVKITKLYNTKTTTFKEEASTFIKPGVNARHVLRISRVSGKTNFYINNNLVHTDTFIHNYCLNGVEVTGTGSVAVDYFKIYQQPRPILNAPDFPATLKKEKLSDNINSTASDLNPLISHDGSLMFFTRQNHADNIGANKSYDDIWLSHRQPDGSWSRAENVGAPLNDVDNNDVFSLSADNNTVLLNNIYKTATTASTKGFSTSTRTATGWSTPQPMIVEDYYNDDPFSEACLSANNKVFIMAVNRKDSRGGRDLYACFVKPDGSWSAPVNMGNINSFSDESAPFLAADGITLYFASSGWPGYGNRDLFVSKRLDDTWTKWTTPLNLGSAINTPNFEGLFRMEVSGETAYMTSTNAGTSDDIYVVRFNAPETPLAEVKPELKPNPDKQAIQPELKVSAKPNPVAMIHGKVLNANTRQPVEARIVYEKLATAEEVGLASSNPATGEYKVVLPYGVNYGLHAKAKGYISVNENLDLTKVQAYQEVNYDLFLVPLEVGQTIKLNNVFFVRGRPQLLPDSSPELDRLYEILFENSKMEIALAGHTDNQGDAKLNQQLSEQRVMAVKAYLVKKGIGEKRITGKGYGSSKPIADNTKEETRRLNRRVEFTITKK